MLSEAEKERRLVRFKIARYIRKHIGRPKSKLLIAVPHIDIVKKKYSFPRCFKRTI